MTAHELLIQARNLIEDPKQWAGHAIELEPGRHCAYTATYCGYTNTDMEHEIDQPTRKEALRAIWEAAGWYGGSISPYARLAKRLVEFNDSHTHEEVLELFDRAIGATAA